GKHDVVIGPARDGGYWLIGLRARQPELFRQIKWSTSDVLHSTLRRAKAAGLTVKLLRELADVDTSLDWEEVMTRGGASRITRRDGAEEALADAGFDRARTSRDRPSRRKTRVNPG